MARGRCARRLARLERDSAIEIGDSRFKGIRGVLKQAKRSVARPAQDSTDFSAYVTVIHDETLSAAADSASLTLCKLSGFGRVDSPCESFRAL